MRRRSTALLWLALALALVPLPSARGQKLEDEGAVFLLIPVGARAIARGQAGVSARLGAEGIWWNPASLGWALKRELAADHAANAFVTGDALDLVVPAGRAGVLGATALYFNFGGQQATDEFGNPIGNIYPSALVLGTTYAATFGERVSAGVSYKYIQSAQSCSGACEGIITYRVSTAAFDVGAHVVVDSAKHLTLGAALKNFGFRLQVNDREQADPLPARLHAGATYAVARASQFIAGSELDVTAEMVSRVSVSDPAPGFRFGAEARFANRFSLSVGGLTGSGDGARRAFWRPASASLGFGIRQGTLSLDFARTFGGQSAEAGEPPTYVTFRVAFK